MKVCKYCDTLCEDEAVKCPSCGAGEFSHHCPNCGSAFDGAFCPICGVKYGTKPRRCPRCGREYYTPACPDCGYAPGQEAARESGSGLSGSYAERIPVSPPVGKACSKWVALLLCLFLGVVGAHKFYERKIGIGIVYIFTGGLFGIGVIVDIIRLIVKPGSVYYV